MMSENTITVARNLIERHQLRAAAVAQEHIEAARLAGDSADMQHWNDVAMAVAELRRARRRPGRPTRH